MDYGPPGSSVHGTLQARILEWTEVVVGFSDRIKLIWVPWRQSRASGIQSGKLRLWEVKGPDKWFLTLGCFWESNKVYGLPPQSTWVVPLSLSLSHTHSHKYTHIPKSEFPRQQFHWYLQKRLCFWLLSSWTDAEFTIPFRECSTFLSLGHSDAKEKATLLSTHFSTRGHQWFLVWLLVAPPVQKPQGQFTSLRWCFSEGQMF